MTKRPPNQVPTDSPITKRKRTLAPPPPTPPTPPHPLGIKPLGNQFLAQTDPGFIDTRTLGLGHRTFARFSDEFILAWIVTYLNCPRTICKLSQTSKAWYAWYAHDEIWKAWVLESWYRLPLTSIRVFCHSSWRRTYVNLISPQHPTSSLTAIMTKDLYSDLLYQPHLYATTPLSYLEEMLMWMTSKNYVRQMDTACNPSNQAFAQCYEATSTPVLLRDCMHTWPAMSQWTDWDTFENLFGSIRLRAESVCLTLSEYLTYMRTSPRDEAPMYLFDKDFPKQGTAGVLLKSSYIVPSYFSSDLFSVLGDTRPDHAWLIIGPERSGSTHHKDPNMTSAWNAVILGAKLWIMYPPSLTPPGVFPSNNNANVSTPISLMDWWLNHLPATKQLVTDLAVTERPIWTICRAGEIVYVPSGWWHTVINLEPALAITQNFVSKHNLHSVLSFLHSSRDLVSGYGNADDAIDLTETLSRQDATQLYEKFVMQLRLEHAHDSELMSIVGSVQSAVNADVAVLSSSLWDTIVNGNSAQAQFQLFY